MYCSTVSPGPLFLLRRCTAPLFHLYCSTVSAMYCSTVSPAEVGMLLAFSPIAYNSVLTCRVSDSPDKPDASLNCKSSLPFGLAIWITKTKSLQGFQLNASHPTSDTMWQFFFVYSQTIQLMILLINTTITSTLKLQQLIIRITRLFMPYVTLL